MNGGQISPADSRAISEQIRWWQVRGIRADDAARALGRYPITEWAVVRRIMERWVAKRRGA